MGKKVLTQDPAEWWDMEKEAQEERKEGQAEDLMWDSSEMVYRGDLFFDRM